MGHSHEANWHRATQTERSAQSVHMLSMGESQKQFQILEMHFLAEFERIVSDSVHCTKNCTVVRTPLRIS